jgi:hypothetical protein
MWVSFAPSLTAILPPHPVADKQQGIAAAEDCDDADQVGDDVTNAHGLFPFVCINCGAQAQAQFSAAQQKHDLASVVVVRVVVGVVALDVAVDALQSGFGLLQRDEDGWF